MRAVDATTGCATILVDDAGENAIVVVPGANALVDAAAVPDAALKPGALLLLQNEVPCAANAMLAARAARAGVRTLLNAAPARPLPHELLGMIDTLVINEGEAAALAAAFGWPARAEAFAAAAATAIASLGVVVTLGAAGAVSVRAGAAIRVDAPRVPVVDTTGAGDAFVGAFAAALAAGADHGEALRSAVAAGSLACTARGAQPALPMRAAIDALLPLVTSRRPSR